MPNDQKIKFSNDRTIKFFEYLYAEKQIHKEHRHKHVIYKLVLSGSFFGLGQITSLPTLYHLFLYIVPFVALVHDVYIFAEHFKIHRIGIFLRYLEIPYACKEEINWERYASEHREKKAYWASFGYTVIVTVFSALAIYFSEVKTSNVNYSIFIPWVVLCIVATAIVFNISIKFRIKINEIEEKLKNKAK